MQTRTQLLEGAQDLAVNPDTPATLLRVLDDPTVGADVLLPTVEYDPELTASLLRVCNSCLFAGNREIGTVREALVRVGNLNFARIAFIVCLEPMFSREMRGYRTTSDVLWHHSLAVAYASQRFCSALGADGQRERAFTAGILHDIGKLMLDDAIVRDFDMGREADGEIVDCALERRLVGVDHAALGGEILEQWQLPEEIVTAAAHHHDVDYDGAALDMVRAVHAADEVVHMAAPDADRARAEAAVVRLEGWGIEPGLIDDVRSIVAEAGRDILPVLLARRR